MNKKLEEALVSIIQQAQEGVANGVSFLSSQIPDVIHQLLIFNLVESFLWLFIVTLLLVAIGYGDYLQYKWVKSNKNKYVLDSPIMFSINLFQLPSLFLLIIAWCDNLRTVLVIWLAPKIYLIEYAAKLTK